MRYTQKELKQLVRNGYAIDVTECNNLEEAQQTYGESYFLKIGYSASVYGLSGLLMRGATSGKLYAVTARTMATFIF